MNWRGGWRGVCECDITGSIDEAPTADEEARVVGRLLLPVAQSGPILGIQMPNC